MTAGFDRIGLGRFAGIGEHLSRTGQAASIWIWRGLLWLLAVIIVGCGVWILMLPSEGSVAQGRPVIRDMAAVDTIPATPTPANPEAATPSQAQTQATAELDRLRISSQTWRRGGLGSKALVTFTLRNDNDYAVKDLQITCAFTRRDGSHLTDRSRMFAETVSMNSRKTFARIPVGYININADQAKCSVVAAHRA